MDDFQKRFNQKIFIDFTETKIGSEKKKNIEK